MLILHSEPKLQDKAEEFLILRRSSNNVNLKRSGRSCRIGKFVQEGGLWKKRYWRDLTRKATHGWATREFPGPHLSIVSGMVKYSDMKTMKIRSYELHFYDENVSLLLESGSGYSKAGPQWSGFDNEKRNSFMGVDGGFYGGKQTHFH